jgi:hypothetical protein
MLRACACICSTSKCSMDIGGERTFIPWNLGSWKSS